MTTLTVIFDRQNKTEAKKAAAKFGGTFKNHALDQLTLQFETETPYRDGVECRAKFGAKQASDYLNRVTLNNS